uniref:Aminopeptidase n=1 Tax=Ditylenchus dipsaci TaxID=166011 RepID=A0A915EUB2_9BILA
MLWHLDQMIDIPKTINVYHFRKRSTIPLFARIIHTSSRLLSTSLIKMTEDVFSKLPELAKPSVYDLYLKPCLKTFECVGQSTIHLDITQKTDYLRLHCNEIEIKTAALELSDGNGITQNLKLEFDNKWTLLTVRLPKELAPQKAKLSFNFVGQLNNKMQGFSRSSYNDEAGNEKFMASTQFESTYARSAFPCWDEPEYKAVFNVSLEVDEQYTALSNMNVIDEQKLDGGKKVVKFATTPIMSTYLVAFAVGNFEYIQKNTEGGIDVRVYTIPGKKNQGQFALDLAAKFLDYYSEWFGIPCPLPKCDLIAIPDFSMGAMENWGLVTYREIALNGGLIWLKEGFASFMEYVAVAKMCPEFNIWLIFLKDEVTSGWALDSMRSSHPIEVAINNPNELDEIYDSITYAKSNSMNRMLCNYLTEPVFQKGLRNYLKKFQYKNAQTTDLWNALAEASGQDINTIMSSWTKQMGYPLVTVDQQIDGEKRILKLKQARFISDGGADELNSIWQVPIEVISASDPSTPISKLLFTKSEDVLTVDGVKPTDWIKLNAGTSGFYRVQYSDKMLTALLPAVQSKEMLVADRFGLAEDLFALVESGKIPSSQFLKFVAASSNEDEYIVWSALDCGISALSNVFMHHGDKAISDRFDSYIVKCLEPVAQRLGWEPQKNEGSQTGLLRALTLGRLAKAGHQPTIETAMNKFNEHVSNGVELNPDLRGVIFGCVGRSNKKEEIAKLQKIFKTCNFGEVERSCIVTMSQCSDQGLLEDVYKWGVNDGNIRAQDLPTLFAGSHASKNGQDYIWTFFKQNIKLLLEKFGSTNSILFQRVLKFTVNSQCSEAVAKDVESFYKANFDEHNLKVLDRPIKQILESIRLNEKLLKNNVEDVKSFLESA